MDVGDRWMFSLGQSEHPPSNEGSGKSGLPQKKSFGLPIRSSASMLGGRVVSEVTPCEFVLHCWEATPDVGTSCCWPTMCFGGEPLSMKHAEKATTGTQPQPPKELYDNGNPRFITPWRLTNRSAGVWGVVTYWRGAPIQTVYESNVNITVGFASHSFQPSFFSITGRFPWVL